MRAFLAIVASAAFAVACGTATPTSVEAPAEASSGPPQSQTLNANACAAQSISIVYTPVGSRHVMTVLFLDGRSNDVYGGDCPELVWSVTPQGAHVQPLNDGSRMITQAELIVTGARQTYTVTVRSGTMTASVAVTAGR